MQFTSTSHLRSEHQGTDFSDYAAGNFPARCEEPHNEMHKTGKTEGDVELCIGGGVGAFLYSEDVYDFLSVCVELLMMLESLIRLFPSIIKRMT